MIKNSVWTVLILTLVASVAAALGFSGAYNVAADEPHSSITARVIDAVRERSIAVRADSLRVPNLADRSLIALGAEHYAEMCTGCHLAPGMPAWGGTHDDATVWAIVAFLQQLPTLDSEAYAVLTGETGAAESGETTMDPPAVVEPGHADSRSNQHKADSSEVRPKT